MSVREGIRRGAAALLVAGGLALAAGCGGDEETADTAPIRPEAATATDETATTEQTETTETTTEQTVTDDDGGVGSTEKTETETTEDSSGGVSPDYDPGQPDSEVNDVPPEPGTPQDKFEQYCAQHPDACG